MRRYLIRGGIIITAIFAFCDKVNSQTTELACPAGTTSVQSLQSTNTSTSKLRQNYCIDSLGNVSSSFTGGITATSQLNNTLYTGGAINVLSGDIGNQINATANLLPSIGGRIGILCNSSGGNTYNFSTPITLTTTAKIVTLFNACSSSPGLQLNYTPTTGTSAITIDYSGAVGLGEAPLEVMTDITLINNGCATAGGCGSSATGITIGSVGGANIGMFTRVRVMGFGTGVNPTTLQSWGMLFIQSTFVDNTTGFNLNVNIEGLTFFKCVFGSNTTAFNGGASVGGDIYFAQTHFDQSQTIDLIASAGSWHFVQPHFENQNTAAFNCNHINVSGSAIVVIEEGTASDDVSSGAACSWWFQSSGNAITITDLYITTGGRTTTQILNALSPVRGFVRFINGSSAILTTTVGGANSFAISDLSYNANSGNPGHRVAFNQGRPQVSILSQSASVDSEIDLGRTATDTLISSIANNADQFNDSLTGDIAIAANGSTSRVILGGNRAGGVNSVVQVSGTVLNSRAYGTTTNCSSSASPAVCGSAAAGSFNLPAAATTVTVNTTAVTANSQIFIQNDDSLGTRLGVTCNTTLDQVFVSARVAGTSFTITGTAPVTNPNCYSYLIIN